ncbi:hypothetical protein [Sphingomonas sp.]|uniref:hypothetical protein n=1 Tax=Sphingomonas sp. TaxID=28214 RepID=UPI003B007CD3
MADQALPGFVGRQAVEGRVYAVPIAITLDLFEQRLPRLDLRRPSALMDEFDTGVRKRRSIRALLRRTPARSTVRFAKFRTTARR